MTDKVEAKLKELQDALLVARANVDGLAEFLKTKLK